MIARAAGVLAALLLLGAGWLGWSGIDRLRGTPLWEFRYLVLGIGWLLLLTFAEWVHAKIRQRLDRRATRD